MWTTLRSKRLLEVHEAGRSYERLLGQDATVLAWLLGQRSVRSVHNMRVGDGVIMVGLVASRVVASIAGHVASI